MDMVWSVKISDHAHPYKLFCIKYAVLKKNKKNMFYKILVGPRVDPQQDPSIKHKKWG